MNDRLHPLPEIHSVQSLAQLRRRILDALLISGSILGSLLYLAALIPAIEKGISTAIILYTVVLAWALAVTAFRSLPYMIRAGSVLGVLFILGVYNLTLNGLNVDGGLFLLTFIVMAALLGGTGGGLAAIGMGSVAIAITGFLVTSGSISPNLRLHQEDPMLWIIGGIVLLMMGVLVTVSLGAILRGLSGSLERAREMTLEAARESESLARATAVLEFRSNQIRTASEISRIVSGVLEQPKLLQQVVDLLKERFGLYYAGVFLVDDRQRFAILQAGTGEAGQAMMAEGHKLMIAETSMIGWTILHRQPRIASDAGLDAVRFQNPNLPLTRSELSLPIAVGDRALGALTIQSTAEGAFDENDISLLQGIADTLAVAVENARLFSELEQNLEETRRLHASYLSEAWSGKVREEGALQFAYGQGAPGDEGIPALDVPLSLREQIIGQLTIEGSEDWTPEERNLVEAVATQAALALENARLLEESQQTALRERLAADITNKVWGSTNIDAILQTAVRELGRALRAEEATIELNLPD
ncbi:MAG: GAF domain-containing protein [Chloroflexi bacterium]|nr:GAF domain-containing protein [Chloroflexota bacterium]